MKQKDRNMVSQGQYWNPVMAAYLFPRGENFEDIKTFERYDDSRKFPVQYWPVSEPTYASQNPYWTAYRNVATNEKSRYMFNVGLTYKITDWLNAAARFRMDDTHVLSNARFTPLPTRSLPRERKDIMATATITTAKNTPTSC